MKFSAAFVLAAAVAVSPFASAAPPPVYFPASNAPLTAEPFLAPIESAFVVGNPQPTLQFPLPSTGARLATRAEFLTALEVAITNDPTDSAAIILAARRAARISDGTPANRAGAPDIGDILYAAAAVPAAISYFGEILDALLAEDPVNTTILTANAIGAAALSGANASDLGAMAEAGAVALVNGFKPADAPYEEFVRTILANTITTDLTNTDNAAIATQLITGFIRGIRDRSMETALLDDVMRGAARAYGTMPNVTLTDISSAAFNEATVSRQNAILIAAACVSGTPFFYLDQPIDQEIATAGSGILPAFSDAITAAASHALTIRVTELRTVGAVTLTRIQTDGTANSDALVCAALMASPTMAYDILRAGLDGSFGPNITPPPQSFPDWIRVALAGDPAFAGGSLPLIIDAGTSNSLFANGVTLNDAIAAVITAGSPSQTAAIATALVPLISSGQASDVVVDPDKLTAAAEASPQPFDVASLIPPLLIDTPAKNAAALKKAILGVTAPELRGAIAASAILADAPNAAAYTTAALAADPSAADDPAINAALAGTQIGLIATQPKWRIASSLKSLISRNTGQTPALVYGALLAAPKQTLSILAAAMSADSTFDLPAALALDPTDATSLTLAGKIADAEDADAIDPGTTLAMLFNAVDSAVLAHSDDVLNLVAAASIASPRYAHHTLHAAAFRNPAVALRTVQTTFDAAPIASPGNQTGRAAAIGAALINGLREARTGKLAADQMQLAIGTATAAARGLTGPAVLTSTGAVNRSVSSVSNGPAAVITGVASQLVATNDITFRGAFLLTPATAKAPGYALAIAQAAAQASVSIGGAKVNSNAIVDAVAAAFPPYSAAQIRNAVTFGRLKARLGIPGAGADGVLNYQYRGDATDPLPSLQGF